MFQVGTRRFKSGDSTRGANVMNQSEKQAPSINACVVLTQENTQGLSFTLVGRKTEQKTSAPVCDNTLITTTAI
jgi:hypothetical protein